MQASTLSAFRWALSLVTSAAWYSHPSYRLNVKLKLFLLPALKRLRTLLLVGSASALLPLFKAFTVINDGLNPSLACLPQCKPGCNHPFSCSSPPAFPGCQPCSASGRTETSCTAPQNVATKPLRLSPSHWFCTRTSFRGFAEIQNACFLRSLDLKMQTLTMS